MSATEHRPQPSSWLAAAIVVMAGLALVIVIAAYLALAVLVIASTRPAWDGFTDQSLGHLLQQVLRSPWGIGGIAVVCALILGAAALSTVGRHHRARAAGGAR